MQEISRQLSFVKAKIFKNKLNLDNSQHSSGILCIIYSLSPSILLFCTDNPRHTQSIGRVQSTFSICLLWSFLDVSGYLLPHIYNKTPFLNHIMEHPCQKFVYCTFSQAVTSNHSLAGLQCRKSNYSRKKYQRKL